MKKKAVSILGCGWLGIPLAKALLKENYTVKGSTTRSEKLNTFLQNGIEPYLLKTDHLNENTLPDFIESDILIIALPPSAITVEDLREILNFAEKAAVKKLILISSTGIYTDTNSEISEDNFLAIDTKSKLYSIEKLVKSFEKLNPVILRMAGLMGYDRHPIRYVQSPKIRNNPGGRINMVHQKDAIRLIIQIIGSDIKSETFNCCTDAHPTKKEFYTRLAETTGTDVPVFENDVKDSFKIISNEKVKRVLNFEFSELYDSLKDEK